MLEEKIGDAHYRGLIVQYAAHFSSAEQDLLSEIVAKFDFDVMQTQALVQAVLQQSRFDPNANHIEADDDEDVTGVCLHCLNPPMPPLRDYLVWREKQLN